MRDCYFMCRDCGELFLFPRADRIYYQKKGYREPCYCRVCRSERKQRRALNQRRMKREGWV